MNRQLQFLGLPSVSEPSELKKTLAKHGFGTIEAVKTIKEEKAWVLDSITYLSRNPAVVGLLVKNKNKYQSVKIGKDCQWCTSLGSRQTNSYDAIEECLQADKTFLVWRMWIPIQRALSFGPGDLHMTSTAMGETERIEMEMTSAFMPIVNNFKDSKQCVMSQIAKWKSPVLMSNKSGVVLCRPTRNGFRGEKLMSVEGLNQYRQAERLFDTFVKKIQHVAEARPDHKIKIYNLAAHALHAACKSLSIGIKSTDFSMFSEEELKILLAHDKHLDKAAKTVRAAEESIEAKHKADEKKKLEKMDEVMKSVSKKVVVKDESGPRDAATLRKEREERKRRLQKLQAEAREDEVIVQSGDGGISSLMLL